MGKRYILSKETDGKKSHKGTKKIEGFFVDPINIKHILRNVGWHYKKPEQSRHDRLTRAIQIYSGYSVIRALNLFKAPREGYESWNIADEDLKWVIKNHWRVWAEHKKTKKKNKSS